MPGNGSGRASGDSSVIVMGSQGSEQPAINHDDEAGRLAGRTAKTRSTAAEGWPAKRTQTLCTCSSDADGAPMQPLQPSWPERGLVFVRRSII